MKSEDGKSLVSVSDVAKRLGVTTQTVRNLIVNQGLPAYRLGDYKIDPEELAAWLLTRKTG